MADAGLPSNSDFGRRRWMRILALAPVSELESAWTQLAPAPGYDVLRRPETGLVLLRGRIGGSGAPFNFGEMTMTRCAVRLHEAPHTLGFAFVAGRDQRQVELAAVFDALLQDPQRRTALDASVIAPIEALLAARRQAAAADVTATRVEFFTLVREQA